MIDLCLIQTLAFPTTLQITSVLLNTCFIPNSASSCRKHQLVDECFFKKKFYPHHPPKTSVSRFTTHPPTPPLQENIRLRDITKCTRNKDKQVQKAKPVGTCFPEWKILVFAQEMRGVGRGDSLGRGTLVHSVTEK